MTAAKIHEHTLSGAAFARPPAAGDYYRTKTGGSVLHVTRVARIVGAKGETYRIQAVRVRLRDLPGGVDPLPWPAPRTRRKAAPTQHLAGPVTTRAQRDADQHARVKSLRVSPDQLVQPVRIANKSAGRRDWRDPDDLSPNRRTARTVSGYAGHDEIKVLLDVGTITPTLARTARRFRKEYELGEWGVGGGRNLAQEPTGFSSGQGPSETRLWHVKTYRATARALRPHLLGLLVAIVVLDETIKAYAQRTRRGRREVAGEIVAALSYLRDYYKEIDDLERDGPERV